MKKDIILCGVGGDGIVSIAKIISDAALNMGLNLKQSEIHGMSQRGGSVFSHLRLSSEEIFADVIPEGQADIILSSEPMEALRYLPFLNKEGWVITNSDPFVNINNYPDIELIKKELGKLPHVVSFDANEIARQTKARSNMVLLGATAPYLGIELTELENAIKHIFGNKGEDVIELNLKALKAGYDVAIAQK
jgi:Pyruvate:ferredoxin oxidoreductase and related 2-oxoacid:ferredoxin oxidoreductases, gamma subunit